jgi:glutathione S-transferase
MVDYELYYWSVPFRGQFVRALLAFAGQSWVEAGDPTISKLMDGPMRKMPVPFMGPPLLVDNKTRRAIAQMPAIVLYLGETLNLMPATPQQRAMTIKTVNDANDVIDEVTLNGGQLMWTARRWREFVPRLKKWMALWEEVRLPAWRRRTGRCRCCDRHPVGNYGRSLQEDRNDSD